MVWCSCLWCLGCSAEGGVGGRWAGVRIVLSAQSRTVRERSWLSLSPSLILTLFVDLMVSLLLLFAPSNPFLLHACRATKP